MRTRQILALCSLGLLGLPSCVRTPGFDPMLDMPPQCLAEPIPSAPAVMPAPAPLASGLARVIGTVTDARSNGAVTMAQASVIAPYERHVWGDSTGGFLLDSLPAGHVAVRIRRLGYEPVVRTLTLQPNRPDTLRVALQPGSECPRR